MKNNIDVQTYELNEMLKSIIDEIDDCLMVYDLQGKLIYSNRQVEYVTGYWEDELHEKTPLGRLEKCYNPILLEKILTNVEQGRKFDTICQLSKKNGTPLYLAVSIIGIKNKKEELIQYVCIGKDITNAKVLHEKIHKIKYLDEITGLPNQKAFIELMYNKINGDKNNSFAVILIDVAKMSYFNNIYGVSAGDIIVKELGERMARGIDSTCVLAKLNTDVFAIIQDCEESTYATEKMIEYIFKEMNKPIWLGKDEVYVELKGGVAFYPSHSEAAGQILNKAQIALAKAKEISGKSHCLIYKRYMQEEVKQRMLLEGDMRKAYENNEFIVYYQPFMNLKSCKIEGMEALLRRKKETGEVVSPGSFITLLEEMEIIDLVGIRVIEKVCKQMQEWIQLGYKMVPVAINLSPAQFKNKYLAKDIKDILSYYQIPPELIVLEITETTLMVDAEMAQEIIRQLKQEGCTIAIDDFGTGYSSLGYLKKFLFDHLKIDISFIKEIVESPQDRAIVAAIISIAKALQLKTVAEGIETAEQLELMYEMGCEVGQGYYWDAPMAPQKLEEKYLRCY